MISQKLDLLMKVTNTQNSTLGRALSFDSSYIGRIRTGKRGLPKHQPFVEPAAAFFARNVREPYQKAVLAEAVCPGRAWPEAPQEAAALLMKWLSREEAPAGQPVEQILMGLSAVPEKRPLRSIPQPPRGSAAGQGGFYYGNSGKRSAVEAFLGELCTLEKPRTLLLYSDEDMSWLSEDGGFALRWAMLLTELIGQGCRIKIIHTVSRGIGEMLEAVQKWLPLYASGAIEPYFYPKLRDNVYRRTLFIAQGHSAILSNSIGSHTQESLNIFLTDPAAVQALEGEFFDYFALCKPLMQIFHRGNCELFRREMTRFEESPGNLIVANPVPSRFTMPETVASSMAARTGSKWFLQSRNASAGLFERNLNEGYSVTELLCLPPPETVKNGGVLVPMCDLWGQPALRYTADEYRAHIRNILALLRRNSGYSLVLSGQKMQNIQLFVKEDIGAIVLRSAPPTTVFGVSEQRMTAAFWEYLLRLTEKAPSREKTMRQLEAYLERW